MKAVQRNKLPAILCCFSAPTPARDKSITQKMHQKLHFSVPLRALFCIRGWSMEDTDTALERKELLRCSLQDLFVSSPPEPLLLQGSNKDVLEAQMEMSRRTGTTDLFNNTGQNHRFRFASLRVRHRLLRRPNWRPALGAIPE